MPPRRSCRLHGRRPCRRAPAQRRPAQLLAAQLAGRAPPLRDRRQQGPRKAAAARAACTRHLRAGDTLTIGRPRNNFPLDEAAPLSVFIAGGIGITPMHSMIAAHAGARASWQLHYCARARAQTPPSSMSCRRCATRPAPTCTSLRPGAGRHACSTSRASSPRCRRDAHVYCCGPLPMLDAFEAATRRPAARARARGVLRGARMRRRPKAASRSSSAESGRSVPVAAGHTILDSCSRRSASTCPTPAAKASAAPAKCRCSRASPTTATSCSAQHEKAANKRMMICCSGAKSSKLVLDL